MAYFIIKYRAYTGTLSALICEILTIEFLAHLTKWSFELMAWRGVCACVRALTLIFDFSQTAGQISMILS